MDFEFDPAKSKSNHEKHGIDFVEAQQLWEDEDRLEIPARTEDEPRYVLIAALDQKLWSAFFTYRKGRIRLISVRRARREERELYYESQESREDV
ncbi:MAG: BrnT family toxin [Nitrospira sp.]